MRKQWRRILGPGASLRMTLKPEGRFVIIGGPPGDWLGPMMSPIKALFLSPWVDQEFGMLLAKINQEDLTVIGNLMKEGKVTPVIDSRFTLSEVPAAIRHSEEGHARGKIIITVE
jgi:NADPH:quinone reductase-like Zn-dependent oxidoreductase